MWRGPGSGNLLYTGPAALLSFGLGGAYKREPFCTVVVGQRD